MVYFLLNTYRIVDEEKRLVINIFVGIQLLKINQ